MKKDTAVIGTQPIGGLLARFSFPAILSVLSLTILTITDRYFIGTYIGESALAGLMAALPFVVLIAATERLISVGGAIVFSNSLGAKKISRAGRILGNTFLLSLLSGLLLAVLGFIFLEPILVLKGASGAVLNYATEYTSVILSLSVFSVAGYGMNGFVRASGRPGFAMFSVLTAIVMNIILDYLFIVEFGWGMRGAGLATVLSAAILAVMVVGFLVGKSVAVRLTLDKMKPNFKAIKKVLLFGVSPFTFEFSFAVTSTVFNGMLLFYAGPAGLAAFGISGMAIYWLSIRPMIGLTQAMEVIMAYNFGAAKLDRVKQTLWIGLSWGTGWGAFCAAVFAVFAPEFVSIFTADAQLQNLTVVLIRLCAIALPFAAAYHIADTALLSVGEYKKSFIFNITRETIIGMTFFISLPLLFGLNGVLSSIAVTDTVGGIIGGLVIIWVYKNMNKIHLHNAIR